ncbi:PD-(D/E)XK nuclease family protein [Helicobacter cetorum]|uniref:PDDEXK-like family protein n=1 Tax=Helicobacter cetorum TaxID=138563 RepID=UPI000CF05405|nr:PD-(D/E)XK nuclease family protein [Helicobacter cetorum]
MSDYQTFFSKVKLAFKELEIKRARGLHDYNVFSVFMSESDEVRHSSFLHSFLDPMREHYQKDLFLKVFLKACHLESFGFNSADTKIVKKEVTTNGSRRMDLFLSDGFKHIILENKIYAGDCDNQISDYILGVVKDYQVKDAQDICVLYLTKEERLPSQNSLGDFKIDESNAKLFYKGNNEYILKLENVEQGILFKNLCYEKEIKEWINECLEEVDILKSKAKEVGDLNDFSVIFKQYDKLLDKLYHKEQNMNSELYKTMGEHYKMAQEVAENFDNFRVEIAEKFLKEVKENLEEKLDSQWSVSLNFKEKNVEKENITRDKHVLRIMPNAYKKTRWTFDFGFLETSMRKAIFGFRTHFRTLHDDKNKDPKEHKRKADEREIIKNSLNKPCKADEKLGEMKKWWADYKELSQALNLSEDFVESIANKTLSVKKFSQAILDYFNKHKELVETLNANMDKYTKK